MASPARRSGCGPVSEEQRKARTSSAAPKHGGPKDADGGSRRREARTAIPALGGGTRVTEDAGASREGTP
ncbi:hypothetical protein Scep_013167 [Stephania cephalantha]|uniref:Uncharacterized protein n=1 Tax=Stephania cephalantha TaxID=152367 RepID=A0AAP0JGU3_9MAGN